MPKTYSSSSVAIFAAGCFWCYEVLFEQLKGVSNVMPGYIGGTVDNPTYQQVCTGRSGHAEAVRIEFDPEKISYKQLLEVFWAIHDPTSLNRQGNDIGSQYRSGIFYLSQDQAIEARKSLEEIQSDFTKPIVTEIIEAGEFYPAEAYHHNYYEKNSNQAYCQIVISPKISKFKEQFADWLK